MCDVESSHGAGRPTCVVATRVLEYLPLAVIFLGAVSAAEDVLDEDLGMDGLRGPRASTTARVEEVDRVVEELAEEDGGSARRAGLWMCREM